MKDPIGAVDGSGKKELDPRAVKLAKQALKTLAEEDLLYAHAGAVCSRPPETECRLAEFFEQYAREARENP